jgi:hypothetical protein
MPSRHLDILNCTSEEFFHKMVITKNIFKDIVVSDSRGHMHCITPLTKLSAGNTVIPQEFEQWTPKERKNFIASISTWALRNDQVDWVNVGEDPQHLDDRYGEEYSASYRRKVFQTMEGMVIYHDSQVARNHLQKLKKIPIYLFGEVNVKSILECYLVNYETPAVYPEYIISGILHLQRCEVLLQNMITSQRNSLLESMFEVMKIPLGSYEDLLFVQRFAIY